MQNQRSLKSLLDPILSFILTNFLTTLEMKVQPLCLSSSQWCYRNNHPRNEPSPHTSCTSDCAAATSLKPHHVLPGSLKEHLPSTVRVRDTESECSGGAKETGANHICPIAWVLETAMGPDFLLRAETLRNALWKPSLLLQEKWLQTGPLGHMQPKCTVFMVTLHPSKGQVHTQ